MINLPSLTKEDAEYIGVLLGMDYKVKNDGTFIFEVENESGLLKAVVLLALKCRQLGAENEEFKKDRDYERRKRFMIEDELGNLQKIVGDGK